MKELRKLNVLSIGKIFGVFGFIASSLQMIAFKILSSDPAVAAQYEIDVSQLTFGAMVVGIISATAIYFISGLLVALIYNLTARYFGGIKFDSSDLKVSIRKRVKRKK